MTKKPSANKRLKPHAEVKGWELLTHNLYQHRSMQQLKVQDEPRAYLQANVNTVCIQDVEDSWGESITFVSGQPALTDKVIHDAFGGHDDGELFHQPAALRGSAIVPQLWENTCLLKGISSEERPWLGVLNSDDEGLRVLTIYTITPTTSTVEWSELWNSFMSLLLNRQDVSVRGSWCGQGSSSHLLLSMREGRTLPLLKVSKGNMK